MQLPDLRKLRHVTVVASAGSFTSAANMLAVTQSALTKSVADVESRVGVRLFERLPRGVRLTQAGAAFVARAEGLLEEAADLMTDVEALTSLRRGHLNLGVAPGGFVTFLENPVSTFARLYPGVRVAVTSGTVDETARALLAGRLDICIGAAHYLDVWKELKIEVMATLRHFFIGRPDHPAAARGTPAARELLAYPVILPPAGLSTESEVARAYLAAGLSPVPAHYLCDHFPLVAEIVVNTDAISPVVTLSEPGERMRRRFTVFDDVVHLETHELVVATTRSGERSPAAAAFQEIFASSLGSGEPMSG